MNTNLKTPTILAVLLAAAGTVTIGTQAKADQTLSGAVGLPLNPTAQIPDAGSVQVQGSFADLGGNAKLYGLHGAGRVGNNLEISGGVNRLNASGSNDRDGLTLGAKYLLNGSSNSQSGVRFAVGAGYNHALLKNSNVYAVGTGYLRRPSAGRAGITGHLGVRYDRFENNGVGSNSNKASVFAGTEVPITNDGRVTFVGEVQSENTNSQFGAPRFPYSASLRYRTANGLSASAGLARQGIVNDNGVFIKIGKAF